MKLVNSVKEKNEILEGKLNKLHEQVSDLLSFKQSVQTKFKEMEDNVEKLSSPHTENNTLTSQINTTVRDEMFEVMEKEKRKLNVVISNYHNSNELDDLGKAKHLIHNVLLANDIEVVSAYSTGTSFKTPQQQNITPLPKLIVKLSSLNQKHKLLRISKHLRDSSDFSNVFINPDFTKRERTEQYLLRKELRERRSKGEKNLIISGDQIIEKREGPRSSFLLTPHLSPQV